MSVRRWYLRISLSGLAFLILLMAIVAPLGGDALILLYLAYFWVILWGAAGLLLLAISATRRLTRKLARS
jgi:uncharacterized protein YhhL (DUF1145 family)